MFTTQKKQFNNLKKLSYEERNGKIFERELNILMANNASSSISPSQGISLMTQHHFGYEVIIENICENWILGVFIWSAR